MFQFHEIFHKIGILKIYENVCVGNFYQNMFKQFGMQFGIDHVFCLFFSGKAMCTNVLPIYQLSTLVLQGDLKSI